MVYVGVVLKHLAAYPCSGQFLKGLLLEVKLRLGVDDLVDQLQVLPVQEVSIRPVFRRHGKHLPIELRFDDRSHVVVAAPLALELSQLPALELLPETGVVHLVGSF